VVNGLPALLRRGDRDLEALFDLKLAGEFGEQGRAQRHLQRSIGLRQHL
jgi:hypothetical protein